MQPPPLIELAVFDVAGTTVRDDHAVADTIRAALAAHGHVVERASVAEVMGLPKPVAIRALLTETLRVGPSDAEVESVHADFVARMVDHYAHADGVREIEGARRALHRLRNAGIRVALDTGFSRAILGVLLERLDWRVGVEVDATVTSDEVPNGRPFPDMILRAMDLVGVTNPHHVAKVGDTPADLASGKAADCGLVIGVTSGSCDADELRAYPHTHLLPNVGLVAALLASGQRRLEMRKAREYSTGPRTKAAKTRPILRAAGFRPRRTTRP